MPVLLGVWDWVPERVRLGDWVALGVSVTDAVWVSEGVREPVLLGVND